jgi:HK97 family phage major capsid protein/HK97 family phage prohead protease
MMADYKGTEIDTRPTPAMAEEAQRGLDWRAEFGRGGTEVGVARARDLANRRELSLDTIRRMASFFARHAVDKEAQGFRPGEEGYPSAGRIAWALWGGDPGQSFADERVSRMNTIDNRAAPDALSVGDFVSWDNPGGRARGSIERIERDGVINVPESSFEITGTPEDPAALIRLYREGEDGFEATDTLVAHLFSTLTKIDDLRSENVDERNTLPLISGKRRTNMDQRHVVAVTETDNSYVIEFAKAQDETVMEEMTEELEENSVHTDEEMDEEMIPGVRKGQPLMRRADEMEPVIESERRVNMAISSEMPVERMGGMEILEHSADAIDLSFLNSGRAPLLLDHDPTQQIGVVESVTLDESARKLRATVRFGKSGRASEVYDDVVDGIRGNVSVGYYVKKVKREAEDKMYRAIAWQPLEVSVVSIPADSSVGVGRAAGISHTRIETTYLKGNKMSNDNTGASTAEAAIAKRNAELKQITELAARHNKSNLVTQAIERNMTYAQFQGFLLERNLDKPLHAPDVDMNRSEQKRYSLLRAIESVAKHGHVTGFEAEISQQIARASGKEARGFYVPMSIFAKRDILTTSPANGSNIIAEDYLAGEFIDRLRAALVIGNLGARMMTGLKGDVAIPKMGSGATVAFVGENSAPSESAQSFSQVTMVPRTLASFTDISRKLAIQSDPSVEQIIREDILQSFARKIDEVAIEGGGSNEPVGILGTNGIGSVAIGTNGGAITFASLVNLEREVAVDNALMGNLAFLSNPKVVAAMRNRPRQTSGVEGNFILNDTNVLLGYNVASTTLVPSDLSKGTASNVCSAMIFGNFSDLMIGMWNSPDVLVDPYTGSSAGTIRIAAFQEVDVKVRHAESFAAIKDITTT